MKQVQAFSGKKGLIQLYECPPLVEGLLCGRLFRTRERERGHIPLNNIIRRQISAHTNMNFNKEFKDDIGFLGVDGTEQIEDIVKTSIR